MNLIYLFSALGGLYKVYSILVLIMYAKLFYVYSITHTIIIKLYIILYYEFTMIVMIYTMYVWT